MAITHIDKVCEYYLKQINEGETNGICRGFLKHVEHHRELVSNPQRYGISKTDLEQSKSIVDAVKGFKSLKDFRKKPYVERLSLGSKLISDIIHSKAQIDKEEPPAKILIHFHYLAYAAHVFTPPNEQQADIFKDREIKAIQPSKELMKRIFKMQPPKINPDDEVMEEIMEGIRDKFWYFDFAQGSYPYEHANVSTSLKALEPLLNDVKLYFRSAFWNPYFNTMGVCLHSSLGTEDFVYFYHNEDTGKDEITFSESIQTEENALNICKRVLEKIIILALYDHTQQTADERDPDALKELPSAMKRPSVMKDKKSPKGASLFKLTALDVAKKDTSSLPPADSKSREYSHSFVVSGHYRMARVGKGRKQRKLIYIDEFVKGDKDSPLMDKTNLIKLK
ncbi:hypothetical protein ACMXYX_17790 (plasmid) [Neptuniibacter sp. QD72_48]|uniref:hypothetical protein n=1 Tax=Neptuniibacter sp. QD72_48 TaxID=3398214 RepID=UPI0039F50334